MEPIDSTNPSTNLICPRCGTSLPSHTRFCGSCGEQINKKKEEEGEVRTENAVDDVQGRKVDDTVRIPSLSRTYVKDLQSYQSFKNNEITGQTYKSSSLSQDIETPTIEELAAPSTPVPEIDTEKHDAVPLAQRLGQQITRLPLVDTVYQQVVGTPGSNSGSIRRESTLIESGKGAVDTKLAGDEALKFPVLSRTWGWLPALSLTSAIGVFLEALAAEAGRVMSPWADWLYWFGLLVLFLPIAVRIISPKPARWERITLLVMLGSTIYLLRFLDYPLSFAYNDEFLHWRGAIDLATYGHLFHENLLLPVGPFYPGLEIVTNALSSLTGLSIFASAMVLLGLLGLVLVLSIYLFYEYLSGSAQVAGIATLLFITAPGFTDQTSFAYESLAYPLAIFVVFVVARRNYAPTNYRVGLTLIAWLGIAAVVITHHVTSFGLLAFLLLWTAVFLVLWRWESSHRGYDLKILVGPGGAALVTLVLTVAWIVYTGGHVIDYLYPALQGAIDQLFQVFASQARPHQFFTDGSGDVAPLWERLTALASVALILLGLPPGLFQVWRRYRRNAVILALAIAALVYPATQVAHLASIGAVTGRVSIFLFPAIAFVLALGVTRFWLSLPSRRRSVVVTGAIVVMFFGGWITTTGLPWSLLPGPYLVAADHRSIDPEGVDAAEWTLSYLGPGHRVVGDLTDAFLMGTYGYQWNVMATNEKLEVAPVFTSLELGLAEERILQRTKTQYLVVDRRISTALPRVRAYFDAGEPNAGHYTSPIDLTALTKFDKVQNVSRIFDSGDIIIYDVEAISNASPTVSTSQSLCTPTPSTTVSPSYPKIAKHYTGTIYNIPTGTTTNISLAGIQQQQGAICGSFGGIPSKDPFKGTITTAGQIQFVLTNDKGQATFSFDGLVLPDGDMTGTFCNSQASTGKCSDYGLWNVSPAQSG